jgi:NADH:ubiquinone oxidoreductase subunit 6 (subunit J)
MTFVAVLFYIFALFVVGSAVAVVASRNPVHSVLWLIFAFFNAAGLFVLLGAEMLAMLLVIVYVGAVAVLFLFVVMMLNIKTSSLKKGFQAYLPMGLLLALVLFLEITTVIFSASSKIDISKDESEVEAQAVVKQEAQNLSATAELKAEEPKKEVKKKAGKPENKSTAKGTVKKPENKKDIDSKIKKLEEKIQDKPAEDTESEIPADKILAEADVAIEDLVEVTTQGDEKKKNVTNAQAIGNVLYTQYILYFQASGLILLVAMIGAIVLTLRHRDGVRRQKASVQNARKNSIQMVKVETGKGVE